jgi:exosortase/archaeosortase family protein
VQTFVKHSLRSHLSDADFWLGGFALAATFVALYPLLGWLVQSTIAQERLWHAFLVLAFFSFALLYKRERIPLLTLRLSNRAMSCLLVGYGFIITAALSSWTLLLLPALCAVLAALLFFISDHFRPRLVAALVAALGGFIALSWLMEPMDWPLRMVAGMTSQSFFDWIGNNAQLGIIGGADGPRLILAVSQQLFEVAPECNGFGVITSSLLLTTLVGIYNGLRPLGLLLWLLIALVIGLFMNWLRIAIIVSLAPHMMPHYDLMHEIVGGTTYWATLLGLWFLVHWAANESKQAPATVSEKAKE